ncbi:hypothetical protein H1C71_007675 [Ictidomys tridecemlineatus]|nr:hypothetical protein H1C71_007675 [Ictidomys tridecemlineatus]
MWVLGQLLCGRGLPLMELQGEASQGLQTGLGVSMPRCFLHPRASPSGLASCASLKGECLAAVFLGWTFFTLLFCFPCAQWQSEDQGPGSAILLAEAVHSWQHCPACPPALPFPSLSSASLIPMGTVP